MSTNASAKNSGTSRDSGMSSGGATQQTGEGEGIEAGGTPMEQANKLVGMAREQATTQVASQQDRIAGSLSTLGSALHAASRQMREQDEGQMAGYVEMAASQLDHVSGMLREQDIAQLIDATGQFARRQPALFLAAAFAVGFAGTRFLRSSAPSPGSQGWQSGSSGYGSSFDDPGRYGSSASGSGYAPSGSSGYGASDLESGSGYGRTMGTDDRSGAGAATGSASGGAWGSQASFDSGAEGQ
jgi:hypothetical protein